MNSQPDGGPAFPVAVVSDRKREEYVEVIHAPGMSLRDWFAGMTLQALLAHGIGEPTAIAINAYRLADAMIAQRNKQETQ